MALPAQRKVIQENRPRWNRSDILWLSEARDSILADGFKKVAAMLTEEIATLERIPEPKPHTFRGLPISRESLKIPTKRRLVE